MKLYRAPPFDDGIVTLLLDLDLDLLILVGNLKYPELFCINQTLQCDHVSTEHAPEIITFIDHFPRDLSPSY